MRWRALLLLLCGITFIYLTSLLQDTPYPHPAKIYTSDPTRLFTQPSEIVLSIVGGYLYSTVIWFEVAQSSPSRSSHCRLKHGVGPLKTGAVGIIRQMRKPLAPMLDPHSLPQDGWAVTFEHRLDGAISKIAEGPRSDNSQFAVMYHVIDQETVHHYVRIYYTRENDFAFRDIRLPGSTWIDSFSLEKNAILYSRDPDTYRFRFVALPEDLEQLETGMVVTSEPGDPIRGCHQPHFAKDHSGMLSQVYSPIPDVHRVLSVDIHKTSFYFYVNFTIADNATRTTPLTELVDAPHGDWRWKLHHTIKYDVYTDDPMEYLAFADVTQIQQERNKLNMPKLEISRSAEAKTVVFTNIHNRFWTLDYSEHTEDGHQWFENEVLDAYDVDITGIHVNDDGDLLAVWTDADTVYIYKRGVHDQQRLERKTPSMWDNLEDILDSSPADDEASADMSKMVKLDWRLRMAITPQEGEFGTSSIKSVKFVNTSLGNEKKNYIFVALKNGSVQSYLIDDIEEFKEAGFWTFVVERWDMVTAMAVVIAGFVFDEYYNY